MSRRSLSQQRVTGLGTMSDPGPSNFHSTEDEAFPPLPPPQSPGQGGHGDPFGNEEEDEGDASQLAEVPAAKRKGVKRPQPKLDSQRLISERGLPALRTMFDNVRFKGKGHEAADLRLLMQKMENWAHRLFPKLQFEDFVDKVEKLGTKKDVQTCLKRIRLDMPLTHGDFGQEGEDEAGPEDPDPFGGAGPVHSTLPPSLTEEQQRRMELNRQRALERRLARHGPREADSTESRAVDGPTPVSSANVLDQSDDRGHGGHDDDEEEEEVTKGLDLETDGGSTQPPSEGETSWRPISNECEDRD